MNSKSTLSPLAPERFPDLPSLAGLHLGTAAAEIKYEGRDDVLLVTMDIGTTVAGVFTRSKTASAPVEWCRKTLSGGQAQALVVNSGNANAFTGRAGDQAVEDTVEMIADTFMYRPSRVFTASTGVIGEPLPVDRIVAAVAGLKDSLTPAGTPEVWQAAAEAIMTTDTFPKGATRSAAINGSTVTINGIAKGSGMIAPDMATMLAFIFTDATLPAPVLQLLLEAAAEKSFNCITVDSDTSTSDTLMMFATGAGSKHREINDAGDDALADFCAQLGWLMADLAQQVVRDGEGASKFVTIAVTGAEGDSAAKRIALAIANSPLVKTAIAGEDANWGRIVMAVGKSGEKADRDKLAIEIGGFAVARDGRRVENYDESPVAEHMRGDAIEIAVDVGVTEGATAGSAVVWTCDLTHGYISINADYRS
ncbi:MAG: bifunctional glutamate N-acetyltransferase/amino-acid acetyltransferase ArgJ [Pseudomonadota bacterium]|nr:bifunctional glutamate N-acetyltransferase/amino-acid acetyltransferase ArgJ [Pseudomonadota bacterium]